MTSATNDTATPATESSDFDARQATNARLAHGHDGIMPWGYLTARQLDACRTSLDVGVAAVLATHPSIDKGRALHLRDIALVLDCSQDGVRKSLLRLRERGLVAAKPAGKKSWWRIYLRKCPSATTRKGDGQTVYFTRGFVAAAATAANPFARDATEAMSSVAVALATEMATTDGDGQIRLAKLARAAGMRANHKRAGDGTRDALDRLVDIGLIVSMRPTRETARQAARADGNVRVPRRSDGRFEPGTLRIVDQVLTIEAAVRRGLPASLFTDHPHQPSADQTSFGADQTGIGPSSQTSIGVTDQTSIGVTDQTSIGEDVRAAATAAYDADPGLKVDGDPEGVHDYEKNTTAKGSRLRKEGQDLVAADSVDTTNVIPFPIVTREEDALAHGVGNPEEEAARKDESDDTAERRHLADIRDEDIVDAELVDEDGTPTPTTRERVVEAVVSAERFHAVSRTPGHTLDELYFSLKPHPLEPGDSEAVKHWAGEILSYYIEWRNENGIGALKMRSWPGQIRKHVNELLVDGWVPRAVCDIVLGWHDSSMDRVRDRQPPYPPGVIKNIAQGMLDASGGAAKHGVDGHGTTRKERDADAAWNAQLGAAARLTEMAAATTG